MRLQTSLPSPCVLRTVYLFRWPADSAKAPPRRHFGIFATGPPMGHHHRLAPTHEPHHAAIPRTKPQTRRPAIRPIPVAHRGRPKSPDRIVAKNPRVPAARAAARSDAIFPGRGGCSLRADRRRETTVAILARGRNHGPLGRSRSAGGYRSLARGVGSVANAPDRARPHAPFARISGGFFKKSATPNAGGSSDCALS